MANTTHRLICLAPQKHCRHARSGSVPSVQQTPVVPSCWKKAASGIFMSRRVLIGIEREGINIWRILRRGRRKHYDELNRKLPKRTTARCGPFTTDVALASTRNKINVRCCDGVVIREGLAHIIGKVSQDLTQLFSGNIRFIEDFVGSPLPIKER